MINAEMYRMSKKKKNKKNGQYYAKVFLTSFVAFLAILAGVRQILYRNKPQQEVLTTPPPVTQHKIEPAAVPVEDVQEEIPTEAPKILPVLTENTQTIDDPYYDSKHSIVFGTDNYEIIASKDAYSIMYPASLTKIMTLIVAAENVADVKVKVNVREEVIENLNAMNASVAGFYGGETPTLEDALYAMILSSGADAAIAIAEYVTGSEQGFVELMNQKATEMGLTDTHFANVTGLHSSNHYSTAADMAAILAYAINNPFCRQVLSTSDYQTSSNDMRPDGMYISSTLSGHLAGQSMEGVNIIGGKTGFTDEAGYCLASFAEVNGKMFVQVYAGSESYFNAVDGSLHIYDAYCKQ